MIDERLERMISQDEVGIATASIGGAVVRSAFQPIFEVRGNVLRPVAVEGFARPFREGAAVPPRVFLARLDERARRDAECISLVLHARNHSHLAEPGLAHVVALDAFARGKDGRVEAGLIQEVSRTAPRQSVGRLRSAAAWHPPHGLASISSALREHGMLASLGGFEAGSTAWEDFNAVRPEIVHFDGPWFRRVAGNEAALRLLAQLVGRWRDGGARILVRGIETGQQLASAIAIGCDLFQGFALARPALVGTLGDFGPKSLVLEGDIERKIVSLFNG